MRKLLLLGLLAIAVPTRAAMAVPAEQPSQPRGRAFVEECGEAFESPA